MAMKYEFDTQQLADVVQIAEQVAGKDHHYKSIHVPFNLTED